ncbi:MAG: sigma-54-dependent transcriptional regulator, partial [Candidatus Rokuibacteriota bacterium]
PRERARGRIDLHRVAAGGPVMKPSILIVDNDPEMLSTLARQLDTPAWTVTTADSGPKAMTRMTAQAFDVILTDLVMDEVDGLALLREARRRDPHTRVILMTAFGSLETAISAIRDGAYDYLSKPFKLDEVTVAVERALEDRRLREENRQLRTQIEETFSFERILGRSPAMRAALQQVAAVAASEASILLLGESGTGKELVARAIHRHSARRNGPFVAVNCAAIPETLLESELFGHEKGAFTGADRKRRGLFVEAGEGTLFLDEVGDIPLPLQAKLLRVLQERVVRSVGGSHEVPLDLRIVSATHRDLSGMVSEGKFRDDLYYRLAVIPIRLPSLRERVEDILLLAHHFLGRAAAATGKQLQGFDDEASAWLLSHRWPGNVRELENVVERAVWMASGDRVRLEDLGTEFAAEQTCAAGLRPTVAEVENEYIRRVLLECKGDKVTAARILGLSVRTLQRKFS